MKKYGIYGIIVHFGDVMHRRSKNFKKLQADFDLWVVKQGQNKNANEKLSALATNFKGYIADKFAAPAYATLNIA